MAKLIAAIVDSASVIARELGGSERLLWSGRPRQGLLFRASDTFVIPFNIVWSAFVFYWTYSAHSIGAPLPMQLVGFLFVAIGIHGLVGRFVMDAVERRATFYGVTNERIVIVSGHFSRRVKTLALRTLTDLSIESRSDGSGTITFGPTHPLDWWARSGGAAGMGGEGTPSFTAIGDAKRVYEIIRHAQQATAPR